MNQTSSEKSQNFPIELSASENATEAIKTGFLSEFGKKYDLAVQFDFNECLLTTQAISVPLVIVSESPKSVNSLFKKYLSTQPDTKFKVITLGVSDQASLDLSSYQQIFDDNHYIFIENPYMNENFVSDLIQFGKANDQQHKIVLNSNVKNKVI